MSTKKVSTPRKRATTETTRLENRRKLARDLAAVFANPELPVCLHNDIGEAMNEYFNRLPAKQIRIDETEDYIILLLEAGEAAAQEQRGGTR